ncbi:hypothetical protein KO516_17975 [Citreicella sp. C3M06]|nr:hypothetical protein [Citreicella sp. C3M06]
MNIWYGGLCKTSENFEGITIFAVEMAQICAGSHPDKTRRLTALELRLIAPTRSGKRSPSAKRCLTLRRSG